jgi:translation elongation factor EF-1beta
VVLRDPEYALIDTRGDFLGEVVIVVKIMPEEPGKEDDIKKGLECLKSGKVGEIRIEPFAFGINVVRAAIVVPDQQDNVMEALEKELKEIEGVGEIEVEGTSLV